MKARRARRSYGIVAHKKFIEGVHDEKEAWICPKLGKRVQNHMY